MRTRRLLSLTAWFTLLIFVGQQVTLTLQSRLVAALLALAFAVVGGIVAWRWWGKR